MAAALANEDAMRSSNVRICRLHAWPNYDGLGFSIEAAPTPPYIISTVESDSPAAAGGLNTLDVVLAVNNQDVSQSTYNDVKNAIINARDDHNFVELLVVEQRFYGRLTSKNVFIDPKLARVIESPSRMPSEYKNFPKNTPRTCEIRSNISERSRTPSLSDSQRTPPEDIRLCSINRGSVEDSFGCELNYHKREQLHILKIQSGQNIKPSNAALAGVKNNDRLVEINGQNIQNFNHEQVVQRIRGIKFPQLLELLVADTATYDHYKQQGKLIHSRLPSIRIMAQKKSNRTPSRTLSFTRDPKQSSDYDEDDSIREEDNHVGQHYMRPSRVAKSASLSINICKGDLITQRTDVIVVCSSSQYLFNSICKAGGDSLSVSYNAELAKNPEAPVVAVKAAGELASKRVYFLPWTVNSDTSVLCRSLQKFVSNAIGKAVEEKYRSITFPAIGCGQYGCPIDLVAQTLVEEAFRQSRMDGISVSFVIQPERKDIYNEFRKQLNLLQSADKVESTSVAVGKGIIEVEKGDITMQKVDVIVGSSSSEILRKTIINAAGNEIQIAYDNEYINNPNSLLIVTPPGALLCKRIFFIKWNPDAAEEILRQSLVDLIWNVIQNAMTHKFTSIAFPAIGCGKHGCSIDVVVQTMVNEMKEQLMKRNLPWTVKFVVQPDQQNIYDEFCKHLLTTPQDGSLEAKGYQLPTKWETSSKDKIRFVLSTTSDEYRSVFTKFDQAMKGQYTQIIRIERIQNERWYIQYLAHSKDFEKRLKIDTEKCLYHGCPEQAANSIIEDGFNRSFAGKNGVVYGFGVYFSSNAPYSHGFAKPNTNGERFMFVARVLIGKATKGDTSMTTRPVGFDSTTGLDHIFVTYHDAQAFAEYLISYK